jgi:hypothetical protein
MPHHAAFSLTRLSGPAVAVKGSLRRASPALDRALRTHTPPTRISKENNRAGATRSGRTNVLADSARCDAWTLAWLDVRQVEITDRRRPGQCPCQLVEVTALLAPGEVLLVVLARRPALYQNKVITVIKVSRNFYTLAAILISGVGQDGTKGLYQLQAGAPSQSLPR